MGGGASSPIAAAAAAASSSSSSSSSSSNAPSDKPVDLSDLPPKPLSGYFLFLAEKRKEAAAVTATAETQEEGAGSSSAAGKSIAKQAALFGRMWRSLGPEEKEVYQERSRKMKADFEAALRSRGLEPAEYRRLSRKRKTAGGSASSSGLQLPVAAVRRIIKLDADVRQVSKAATMMITKASELFLEWIARDVARTCTMNKRRTVQLRDYADSVKMSPHLEFLRSTLDDELGLADLPSSSQPQKKRQRTGPRKKKSKTSKAAKAAQAADGQDPNEGAEEGASDSNTTASNTKRISDFFRPAAAV